MSTPGPATLDLLMSRSQDFELTLLLQNAETRNKLELTGFGLRAQLYDLDVGGPYFTMPLAVDLQQGVAVLPLAAATIAAFIGSVLSGGDAADVGAPPEISGGDATTVFSKAISGGQALLVAGATNVAWDLLMVEPRGNRRVLLRGVVSFTD